MCRNTYASNLAGLELAKYVLMRLVDNSSVEKLAEEFVKDVRFIKSIVEYLKNIKWIEQLKLARLKPILRRFIS
jgi:hypothetical protein